MSNDITKLADIQLTAPQLEKLQYRLARADIDNSMVSDLGIACEMATAYLELKEKYDRYEKALKAIVASPYAPKEANNYIAIAMNVLSEESK